MVVTTGFFDGVHLGHRIVIDALVRCAKERADRSTVITFWPHPRNVLQKGAMDLRLLSSMDEKVRLLKDAGVDNVEVVEFTREFSLLTAEQYLREYVRDRFGGTVVLLGYDNRFGNVSSVPEDIALVAANLGLEVVRTGKMVSGDVTLSSSKIRKALQDGQVEKASEMLGYDYQLHGVVVAGNQLGRRIGFPTANMQLYEPLKMIPVNGVYQVEVETGGCRYKGMTNIGVRPTVGRSGAQTIETNIFDFDRQIYGLDIRLFFKKRLRDEIKFTSLEELTAQLHKDRNLCME